MPNVRESTREPDDSLKGEPPDFVKCMLWISQNGKNHPWWGLLSVLVILALAVPSLKQASQTFFGNKTSEDADRALKTIDRVLHELEQVWGGVSAIEHGRAPTPKVTAVLSGKGSNEKITFTERQTSQVLQSLTIQEVRKRLSKEEMRLLFDTEAAMQSKVGAWRREYKNIRDPAAANVEAKKRLLRIAAGMSADLDAIFRVIQRTLNGELQDHYGAERWIASTAAGLLAQIELEKHPPV